MDIKKRNRLFLIAAIFLAVSCAFNLFELIYFAVDPAYFLQEYIELFESIQTDGMIAIDLTQLEQALFVIVLVSKIVATVSCLGFSIFYFVCAKFNEEKFQKNRVLIIVLSFVQIIFAGNILSGVCSLVAVFSKNRQSALNDAEVSVSSASADVESEKQAVAKQINRLKQLRESGAITDEEYEKLLCNIIK